MFQAKNPSPDGHRELAPIQQEKTLANTRRTLIVVALAARSQTAHFAHCENAMDQFKAPLPNNSITSRSGSDAPRTAVAVATLTLLFGCASAADPEEESIQPARQAVAGGTFGTTPKWSVGWRQKYTTGWCSASVLNEHWLLTAAHCVEPLGDEPQIQVYFANAAGSRALLFEGRAVPVAHPDHTQSSYAPHDVGLLYLASSGMDLTYIGKAKLYADPRRPWLDSGEPNAMYLAGWGRASGDCENENETGTDAGFLRFGSNLHVDFNPYNTHFASAAIGSVHACRGDSGSPYLLLRGTESNSDFLQFAVHSGRRATIVPPLSQFTTTRHQGPLIADNFAWIQQTLSASTSAVFEEYWVSAHQGSYLYEQSRVLPLDYRDVQGFQSRCLHDAGASFVQMRACDGSSNQRWRFELSGEVRREATLIRGSAGCLTASSMANRTQLKVAACDGSLNQKFWYDSWGQLRPSLADTDSPARKKCVEAPGSANDSPVQVFDCNGTAPQLWLP